MHSVVIAWLQITLPATLSTEVDERLAVAFAQLIHVSKHQSHWRYTIKLIAGGHFDLRDMITRL